MKMGCVEVKELLPLFVSEELSDEERSEVRAHLEACEPCRRELEEIEEAILLYVSRPAPASEVAERLVREARLRIPAGFMRRRAALAAAAGFLLVAGLALFAAVALRDGGGAKKEEIAGVPAAAGPRGEDVASLPGERLEEGVAELDDGSRLCLAPGTEAYSVAWGVRLIRGEVFCRVTPQGGESFRVETDLATVEVVGTEFDVACSPECTRVAVLSGEVRVKGGGGSAVLGAGEVLEARSEALVERRGLGARALARWALRLLDETERVAAGPASEEEPGGRTVSGTVALACPQGKFLRLKTDEGEEVMLPVAAGAREDVRALAKGERVVVRCVLCPQTGEPTVVCVEREEEEQF